MPLKGEGGPLPWAGEAHHCHYSGKGGPLPLEREAASIGIGDCGSVQLARNGDPLPLPEELWPIALGGEGPHCH